MKAARLLRLLAVMALPLSLAACLEVDQHPPYVNGAYAGQPDNQPQQVAFKGDRAAWEKAIAARVQGQDEFRRTRQ